MRPRVKIIINFTMINTKVRFIHFVASKNMSLHKTLSKQYLKLVSQVQFEHIEERKSCQTDKD